MSEFEWGNKRRFNSWADQCRRIFGTRLQKLSIDAGFTCPNRDGTKGTSGCIFCNNKAFNPSYCSPEKSITRQISEGIEFHKLRYRRAARYLAYFQAYSNTYGSIGKLEAIYSEALAHPEISGIAIGTRPDCIDDEKLNLIKKLSANYFISVEFGIESCYDSSLEFIRRGHSFRDSEEAIRKTAATGIHTGGHLILGIPGESRSELLHEAQIISGLPLNSVKLHQLQILKNTPLAALYEQSPSSIKLFKLDEYVELVIDFLELLSPSIAIERLSGEVPPRFLAGPSWGPIRSDQVLNLIEKRLQERNTWQGKLFKTSTE